MQIMYAAPFLVVAAISFFVCTGIPATRPHALVVPSGVLCFGGGSLVTYILMALSAYGLGRVGPASSIYLLIAVLGGLVISILCAVAYRSIVAQLPTWLIRLVLLAGSACSSLVLWIPLRIGQQSVTSNYWAQVAESVIEGAGAISITVWVVGHAKDFRPKPTHLNRFFRTFGSGK